MNERIIQLLDETIENRLENTLKYSADGDPSFGEAMDAIDRKIELAKIEAANFKVNEEIKAKSKETEISLLKIEEETKVKTKDSDINLLKIELDSTLAEKELINKKKEARVNAVIKVAEIVGIICIAPIIEKNVKVAFAKVLCEFEREYTFTTTAGRSLSQLFKFKK